MGIYDREYYRREGPSLLGSLIGRGQVCRWLIVTNVAVFILQLMAGDQFTEAFLLNTQAVMDGQVWRLLTYSFLHDPNSILHIVFNMLFLWWFGSDVEDIYGPREFLAFYLVSALLGGIAFQLAWLLNPIAQNCLGASGAVTAALVLCALHYPNRTILWFFIPLPIWLFVVIQVAVDTFGFVRQDQNTQTAVAVHLAGAAFAFVYYKQHWRLLNLWPNFRFGRQERSRPRLRVYEEEHPHQPVSVGAPATGDVDEQLEAKLDAVLEKVARDGQSSLTESERQILFRASEVYKRRRT